MSNWSNYRAQTQKSAWQKYQAGGVATAQPFGEEPTFQNVFPDRSYTEVLNYAAENPEEFITDLQKSLIFSWISLILGCSSESAF